MGADSERRRLSSIFHTPISGVGCGRGRVAAPASLRPKIQGSSCQSPRTQRCWRIDGDVVARREFLDHFDVGGQAGAREDAFEQIVAESSEFSGTRPASAASKASTS